MVLENLFYVIEAVGKNGVHFNAYKIRTMVQNADQDFGRLIEENGVDGIGKIVDDPRIRGWGRFMRKWGIDESPQLYNILKGEMGIAGIRPRTEEAWSYLPEELKGLALKYKPGFFTPSYSKPEVRDVHELIELEMDYLRQKEISPIRTNIKLTLKIVYNVIFKGLRSR